MKDIVRIIKKILIVSLIFLFGFVLYLDESNREFKLYETECYKGHLLLKSINANGGITKIGKCEEKGK